MEEYDFENTHGSVLGEWLLSLEFEPASTHFANCIDYQMGYFVLPIKLTYYTHLGVVWVIYKVKQALADESKAFFFSFEDLKMKFDLFLKERNMNERRIIAKPAEPTENQLGLTFYKFLTRDQWNEKHSSLANIFTSFGSNRITELMKDHGWTTDWELDGKPTPSPVHKVCRV